MSDRIYDVIFRVAEALELPVVLAALLALAWVIVEAGAFVAEALKRRKRRFAAVAKAGAAARRAVDEGRSEEASALLQTVAWSAPVAKAFRAVVDGVGRPGADTHIAKELADFDFGRQARLGRTRLLVRLGPALGLMGTLIPLTPALDGLARGDVDSLTENLRLAFSITVLGILIGVIALGLSIVRERIYGQDFSDLEFIAAMLTDDGSAAAAVSITAPSVPEPTASPATAPMRATAPMHAASAADVGSNPPTGNHLTPPLDEGSPRGDGQPPEKQR